jgi:putative nucleotidyltransferase with HDIG domain
MRQEQLDGFRLWFDSYVSRFYGTDDYVNAHLRLKQEHTRRTCLEINSLAQDLALDDNQQRVAELIALFHDIGRFTQFAQYRTYSDRKSTDHSRLGVEVLRQERILDSLSLEERRWIETAIEFHGRRSLPSNLTGQTLLFAKLIRDADKLDIFRVVTDLYNRYREDPERFTFEIELPDEPEISPQVVEAVMNGRLVDHASLRTLNDMTLCQIGWVYDLNFNASLAALRRGGFLEQMFSYLPATDQIQAVRRRIFEYVDSRLAQTA